MAHITKVMFLLFFLGASFVYVAPSQAAYSLLCGTAIYVDDSFVGVSDGTSGSPYTTIAAAVAVASAGDVICVNDGTYASTNINQQVTLLGPNAGFNANDPADITASNPTRITEAVVNGTFGLQANNIIVDGFTFSGFALGIAQQVSPFTSMQVLNNNFLNGSFAINFNFGAVFPLNTGLLIENNRIDTYSAAAQTAIWVHNVDGATIRGNYINSGGFDNSRGINLSGNNIVVEDNHTIIPLPQTNGFGLQIGADQPNTMQGITAQRNTFVGGARGIQMYPCAGGRNLQNISILDNEIRDVANIAIWMTAGGCDPSRDGTVNNILIEGNRITQNVGLLTIGFASIDLRFNNGTTNSQGSVTVRNNQVQMTGTYVAVTTSSAIRVRGRADNVIIQANRLIGNGTCPTTPNPVCSGVYVQTNDATLGAMPAASNVQIIENYITGFERALIVHDAVANAYGNLTMGATVNFNRNRVFGNTFGAQGGAGQSVNLNNNWWGCNGGPIAGGGSGAGALGACVNYLPTGFTLAPSSWLTLNNLVASPSPVLQASPTTTLLVNIGTAGNTVSDWAGVTDSQTFAYDLAIDPLNRPLIQFAGAATFALPSGIPAPTVPSASAINSLATINATLTDCATTVFTAQFDNERLSIAVPCQLAGEVLPETPPNGEQGVLTSQQFEELGVTNLPATGETPLWRDWLIVAIAGIGVLGVMVSAVVWRKRQQS